MSGSEESFQFSPIMEKSPSSDWVASQLVALNKSKFRGSIVLPKPEQSYLNAHTLATIYGHATQILRTRLASAEPKNDGKQTPWKGHPVFVAQHATATCCRRCVEKWHGIAKGTQLSDQEIQQLAALILGWLEPRQNDCQRQLRLF